MCLIKWAGSRGCFNILCVDDSKQHHSAMSREVIILTTVAFIVAAATAIASEPPPSSDGQPPLPPASGDGLDVVVSPPLDNTDSLMNGDGPSESGLRGKIKGGSKCKVTIGCSRLGGSCVAKANACNGRVEDFVCKGKTCKCCIPRGVIESSIQNITIQLQAVQEKLIQLESNNVNLANNFTVANSQMDSKLQLNLTALDIKMEYITKQLDEINTVAPTCPVVTCPTAPTCPAVTSSAPPTCPDVTCPEPSTCPEVTSSAPCPTTPEVTSTVPPTTSDVTSTAEPTTTTSTVPTTTTTSTAPPTTTTSTVPTTTTTSTAPPTTTTTTAHPTPAPLGWMTVGSDRFVRFSQSMSWVDARRLCQSHSLDLYEPRNVSAVSQVLHDNFYVGGHFRHWLGARGGSGTYFVWLSGAVVTMNAPWFNGESGYYDDANPSLCLYSYQNSPTPDFTEVIYYQSCDPPSYTPVYPLCG